MGRLGDGTLEDREEPTPVVGLDGVVELGAGVGHACARRSDGTVWCWGANQFGECGVTSRGLSDRRVTAAPIPQLTAASLDVVWHGGCAIRAGDRRLLCWGNGHGARVMDLMPPPRSP